MVVAAEGAIVLNVVVLANVVEVEGVGVVVRIGQEAHDGEEACDLWVEVEGFGQGVDGHGLCDVLAIVREDVVIC